MVLTWMAQSAYHLLPKWSDLWYNMNYRIGTKCTIPHNQSVKSVKSVVSGREADAWLRPHGTDNWRLRDDSTRREEALALT